MPGPRSTAARSTAVAGTSIGAAILELRARMEWGQEDLAKHIRRHGGRFGTTPIRNLISAWENERQSPSRGYRIALTRIATARKHKDLARVFEVKGWNIGKE
jgi:hypothetical protein